MCYGELYDYCQTLTPYLRRNDIKNKLLDLSSISKLLMLRTTLDVNICRGFYLSANTVLT